mgnify:CR=1 FL=1
MFLLYSPLNQGLKQNRLQDIETEKQVFTLQSIKSRIETNLSDLDSNEPLPVFTLQSIKSRIETQD